MSGRTGVVAADGNERESGPRKPLRVDLAAPSAADHTRESFELADPARRTAGGRADRTGDVDLCCCDASIRLELIRILEIDGIEVSALRSQQNYLYQTDRIVSPLSCWTPVEQNLLRLGRGCRLRRVTGGAGGSAHALRVRPWVWRPAEGTASSLARPHFVIATTPDTLGSDLGLTHRLRIRARVERVAKPSTAGRGPGPSARVDHASLPLDQ